MIPNVRYYCELTNPQGLDVRILRYIGPHFLEENLNSFYGKEQIIEADKVSFVYFPVNKKEEQAELANQDEN